MCVGSVRMLCLFIYGTCASMEFVSPVGTEGQVYSQDCGTVILVYALLSVKHRRQCVAQSKCYICPAAWAVVNRKQRVSLWGQENLVTSASLGTTHLLYLLTK